MLLNRTTRLKEKWQLVRVSDQILYHIIWSHILRITHITWCLIFFSAPRITSPVHRRNGARVDNAFYCSLVNICCQYFLRNIFWVNTDSNELRYINGKIISILSPLFPRACDIKVCTGGDVNNCKYRMQDRSGTGCPKRICCHFDNCSSLATFPLSKIKFTRQPVPKLSSKWHFRFIHDRCINGDGGTTRSRYKIIKDVLPKSRVMGIFYELSNTCSIPSSAALIWFNLNSSMDKWLHLL